MYTDRSTPNRASGSFSLCAESMKWIKGSTIKIHTIVPYDRSDSSVSDSMRSSFQLCLNISTYLYYFLWYNTTMIASNQKKLSWPLLGTAAGLFYCRDVSYIGGIVGVARLSFFILLFNHQGSSSFAASIILLLDEQGNSTNDLVAC